MKQNEVEIPGGDGAKPNP